MAVVKVMKGRQVVIPKELFDELGLEVGDYLEVKRQNGKLVYMPKKLVDRDEWYWSPEGQKVIAEALKDIEEGRTVGPFDTAEELIRSLEDEST